MALREVVARNLRRLRRARGMSQERLSLEAGFYRTYVGLLEREKHSPTVDALDELANVLGVNPMCFFAQDSDRTNEKSDAKPQLPRKRPRGRKDKQ